MQLRNICRAFITELTELVRRGAPGYGAPDSLNWENGQLRDRSCE